MIAMLEENYQLKYTESNSDIKHTMIPSQSEVSAACPWMQLMNLTQSVTEKPCLRESQYSMFGMYM